MAYWSRFVPREPQQRRKNPLPTVLEDQGDDVVLIAYGERVLGSIGTENRFKTQQHTTQ
jgi:hypothetical protein